MSTVKDGSALTGLTTFGNTSPAANASSLLAQFISPPLAAGIAFATTDTFSCVIKVAESATNDNINRHPICIKVYDKDGTTLRATLKALAHYGPTTTEWPTAAATKILGSAVVLGANYTTAAGDLLVVEIGAQVDATGGTSVIGTMTVGSSAASDYALTEALTTSINPWFEISRTFNFLFTASGTPTVGPASISGSATRTTPTYTGSGSLSLAHATISGSATLTLPVRSSSGTLNVGHATASGSAQSTSPAVEVPVRAINPALLLTFPPESFQEPPASVLSTYTSIGALTAGHATASGSATLTAPVYSGSGSLTAGHVTLSGQGEVSAPIPIRRVNPSLLLVLLPGPYEEAAPASTYTASGSLTAGHATVSGTASFTAPSYSGSGSVTVGHTTSTGSATFTVPTYAGNGSLLVGHGTLSGAASFSPPVYQASGSFSVGHATFSSSSQFTAPKPAPILPYLALLLGPEEYTEPPSAVGAVTYTASGSVIIGHATSSGSALYGFGLKAASGSLTAKGSAFSGTATFSAGTKTASGSLSAKGATLSGSAIRTAPSYIGNGILSIKGGTLSGSAAYATVVFLGSGNLIVKGSSAIGTGEWSTGTKTGSGDFISPRPALVGTVVTTRPAFQGAGSLTSPAASMSGAVIFTTIPGPYHVSAIQWLQPGMVKLEHHQAGTVELGHYRLSTVAVQGGVQP